MKRLLAFMISCALLVSSAGTMLSASADSAELHTSAAVSDNSLVSGDFNYKLLPDGTAAVTGYCGKKGIIDIPSEIDGKTVTTIAAGAFKNFEATHSVTVVTVDEIFDEDLQIIRLTFPDTLKYIEENAFVNCTSLKSITLPSSIERIAPRAFAGCVHLTEINYPDTLTCIDSETFADTAFATNSMRYKELPDGTIAITGYYGSDGIVNIPAYINGKPVTTIVEDAFDNYDDEELHNSDLFKSLTLPDTLTSIGENVFFGCYNLTEINIPDNLTCIDSQTFNRTPWYQNHPDEFLVAGNGILIKYGGNDTNVTIPDSVKVISANVFERKNITGITIKNNVNKIGRTAFLNCTRLADVSLPDTIEMIEADAFKGTPWLENYPDDYIIVGNGLLYSYKGSSSEVNIPDSVKIIGSSVFERHSEIESVVIPNSVKFIDRSAFNRCTKLRNITIPDSVTGIENAAFISCRSLTDIVLPDSVTLLGTSLFSGTTSLKNVTLPKNITVIPDGLFYGCSALENITIPEGVAKIDDFAFYGCKSLKSVVIPNGVTEIGTDAFKDCASLEEISIPDTVKTIGFHAFMGCTSLKEIVIPDKVTVIGSSSFSGCSDMTEIMIPRSVKSISKNAFNGCKNLTIYGYKNSYAEKFAASKSINFEAIDDGAPDTPDTPDRPETPDTPDTPTDPEPNKPKPTKTAFPGNLDGDEEVTSADALIALRASVKLESLTDEQMYFADVDKDSKITSADSLLILRYSVGYSDEGVTIGFKDTEI